MSIRDSHGRRWFSWAETPRLGPLDFVAMLWAERAAVIGVGAAVCLLGFAIAFLAPKTYVARAELLVRLGQEYVYQPSVGATGNGGGEAPDMQAVVNSELRLLGSGELARRVIDRVGLRTLYPSMAASGNSAQRMAAAERAFSQNLVLETAPQTPTIALSFKHKNPEVAARALNALIDLYLAYRRDVLVGGESDALSRQSADLDARTRAANEALSQFLAANNIGDFDAEKAALAQRSAETETQAYDAAARRSEAEARAAALRTRMRNEPEQIELYTESDARRELVQLQVQREQLLSRYQDDAPPVREVDREIAQLNSFLSGGDPASVTRHGPNPIRQEMNHDLFTAEAEARAQRGREDALHAQHEEVEARLRQLQAIEPQFRQLLRERTILEQTAGNFATRAEEARSFSQLLGRSTDNISQVERAQIPTQGQSLRLPIALLTLMLAGIAATAAGLARELTRRSFPTPSSASRTLDAPLLAVLPRMQTTKPTKVQKNKPSETPAAPVEAPALKVVKGGAA